MPRDMTPTQNNRFPTVPPPTNKNLVIRDPIKLAVELLWFWFVIVPCRLLLGLFRRSFPRPEKSLKDHVVIVTGAGRGLGRGLAIRFAKEGAKVAVVDVDATSASQTAQEIVEAGGIAKPFSTNIAKLEDIHHLRLSVTKALGQVDILVNNAGLVHFESISNISEAEVRAVIEVNLLSHFWMVQEFLPEMTSRNSGHIVAISSLSAIKGLPNAAAYTASKCGVKGFMEALRGELNSNPVNNIKTTTVFPYFINTSENYLNQWDLRLPPLTINQVVKATVTGIKQDEAIVGVPKTLFFPALFGKLLPVDLEDRTSSIVYYRVTPPAEENKEKEPVRCLINSLTPKGK